MAVRQAKEIDSRLKTPESQKAGKPESQKARKPDGRLSGCPAFRLSGVLCLVSCVFLYVGCGSAWRGRIVHLEDGKVVIQPEGDGKIESGRKLLIYRQKTITHPVTGEMLGTIRDNVAEVPVLRVRDRTITATAAEPEFDMMMVDDQATSVRGSVKPPTGSVNELGRAREVDAEEERVEITVTLKSEEQKAKSKEPGARASLPASSPYALSSMPHMIDPGDVLAVIRYVGTVIDPDTGEVLAVAVEPVADLQVTGLDADGRLWASYDLIDKKLGWVEIDDVVVRRTGDMLAERLWFQDPPDAFSETWIFKRRYLHSIRYYDSGRYREAILELSDVVQMDPEYEDATYLLALCQVILNRYEAAVALFKDLLGRRPDDAKTWAALAYAYLKQGKLQEAAESYKKLAHLLPGDSKVWTDIGDIHRMLGDHQKAEQAYRKALEINEDDEEARYEFKIKEKHGDAEAQRGVSG